MANSRRRRNGAVPAPAAIPPTTIQIKRTLTQTPPVGLAQGELSIEMASERPRLWVGVPTNIDPTGRRQVSDLYLPLTGGTINGGDYPLTIQVDQGYNPRIRQIVTNGASWTIGPGPGGQFAIGDDDAVPAARLNIDQAGLVTIQQNLQVNGNATTLGANAVPSAETLLRIRADPPQIVGIYLQSTREFWIGAGAGFSIYDMTADATRLTIDGAGLVRVYQNLWVDNGVYIVGHWQDLIYGLIVEQLAEFRTGLHAAEIYSRGNVLVEGNLSVAGSINGVDVGALAARVQELAAEVAALRARMGP